MRLRPASASFYVRNLRTRLPFRFGVFTLRAVPLLHVALEVEAADGRTARGFAAENLMPQWFDKDPAKTAHDNIRDLLTSVQIAHAVYCQAANAPHSVWAIWREAYPECRRRGTALGLNGLVASFGSALFERALADAAGRLAGQDVVEMLRHGTLGIRPEEVHPELDPDDLLAWAGEKPSESVALRHAVGLLDPIRPADVPPDGWIRDSLPQTLEECVVEQGLRFFKLKVGGQVDADLDRLTLIAATLDGLIAEPYLVSLDGNEQYKCVDAFTALVDSMRARPALSRLLASTAFIEQPLDRAVALDPAAVRGIERLGVPLIIDESDAELDSFKEATALGYRGVSTKNCKGIFKSFLNRSLAERLNRGRAADARLFMTAEDLTTPPVIPVQQDLATVRALGIGHVERNGHHYFRGLAHCSQRERTQATTLHADLYAGDAREAWLRIRDGRLAVGSIETPGYGVAFDPDLAAMTPLEDWRLESLGAAP